MPWWIWPVIVLYTVGFGFGFVAFARRSAENDPLMPLCDPFCAGVCGGIIWPLALLTMLAIARPKPAELRQQKPSRAERRAQQHRRIAEERLAETQALREREKLLGL